MIAQVKPRKSIIIVILLAVAMAAIATMAGYTTLLASSLRYDQSTNRLINTAPQILSRTFTLGLIEGGETLTYPITVTETIVTENSGNSPLYDPSTSRSETAINMEEVEAAVIKASERIERHGTIPAELTADCHFIPSVPCNKLDTEKLIDEIKSRFPEVTEYHLEDYYIAEPDENEGRLMQIKEQLDNACITYSNGESIRAADLDPIYDRQTDSISLNSVVARERVKEITSSYDTAGKTETVFSTTLRGQVDIKGGTWGSISDTEAEMDEAEKILCSLGVSENRIPVMKQAMSDELPDTYIEVDKENQKVFVYEEGTLVMESDCVTGRPDRATPSGIYFISEQMTNKTLRGPGYASFVKRWMRLTNSGVGLHDASWRGRFGGEIYIRDGSHGCINLPTGFAFDLYDWVKTQPSEVCVVVL